MTNLRSILFLANLCLVGLGHSASVPSIYKDRGTGYEYHAHINGWLKLHSYPDHWEAARINCRLEGATLASPWTAEFTSAMKTLQVLNGLNLVYSGVCLNETFADELISYIGDKLTVVAQPHSIWLKYCGVVYKNGTTGGVDCNERLPYVCYAPAAPPGPRATVVPSNNPATPTEESLGYTHSNLTGHWYKFHSKVANWTTGRKICEAEGASLAVPNSYEEAKVLATIHARYLDAEISGTDWPNWISVGIYWESGAWVTVDGQSLSEAGYETWMKGWPKNMEFYPYLVMDRGGKFSNTYNVPYPFICEKVSSTNCRERLPPGGGNAPVVIPAPTGPTTLTCMENLGYDYSNKTDHWYKFHSKVANWTTGKRICEAEGARLAVPNSNEEAKVLATIHARYLDADISGTDWPNWISIGIYWESDAWVTVDGQSLSEAGYETWMEGWPSNMETYPYVVMDRGGKFSNTYSVLYPFICEKSSSINSIEQLPHGGDDAPTAGVIPTPTGPAPTPMPTTEPTTLTCEESLGYEYSNQTGHSYKFHAEVADWTTGKRICEAEGAHLAVPNSNEEAKVLATIHARYLDAEIFGTDWPNWISVGIYWESGAWVTVDGQSLSEAGYETWMKGWPSNMETYPYLVMDRGGKFSNTYNVLYPFICEKVSSTNCRERLPPGGGNAPVVIPAPTGPTTLTWYDNRNKIEHWYKFHSKVANWTTAKRICEAEGARLAVPNSNEEAKVLATIHARYLDADISGTDWPDWISVGIFWESGAWVTVDGQSLSEAGYETWMKGWPSNMETYPYVVMHRGGKFSNTYSVLYPFICEKSIATNFKVL